MDTQEPETDQPTTWLREHAPVAIGDGADAVKRAAVHAAHRIAPHFKRLRPDSSNLNTVDEAAIFRLMRKEWLPRCETPFNEDDLFEAAEEAKRAFEAAEDAAKAKDDSRRSAAYRKEREAARQEAEAAKAADRERQEHTERVNKIMLALGVSRRQAQRLVRDGTTIPEQAKQIAEALDTDAWLHFKRKARSGREPDLRGRFLRGWVTGYAWRDFIEEAPDPAGELVKRFATRYRLASVEVPDHFHGMDDVVRYLGECDLEAVTELWTEYQVWRIRTMADRTIRRIKPDADDFDFG